MIESPNRAEKFQMDAAAAFSSRYSACSLEERSNAPSASLDAWLRKDQAFFVYNAAHSATRIRSPDGTAWIRPLGFCSSIQAAKARGMEIHSSDEGQEIRMQPAGKVFLIGAGPYHDTAEALDMQAREREQAKANAAMESCEAAASQKIQDVKVRAEARRAGTLDLSLMNPRAGESEKTSAESAETVACAKLAPSETIAAATPHIKAIPLTLEMRSQRFAVLAVVEDSEAAAEYKTKRAKWWQARASCLRTKWCADLGVTAPWEETLETWIAEHPAPSFLCIESPLYIDYSWPEETQAWCRARDAALLEAEWSAAGRAGVHAFDYAALVGDESDAAPAPPPQEPAIVAVGACETLEDAEALAQKAGCTKELKHVDVFVCAMYEWGRLSARHTAVKKHPRQLDQVMPSLSK